MKNTMDHHRWQKKKKMLLIGSFIFCKRSYGVVVKSKNTTFWLDIVKKKNFNYFGNLFFLFFNLLVIKLYRASFNQTYYAYIFSSIIFFLKKQGTKLFNTRFVSVQTPSFYLFFYFILSDLAFCFFFFF